MDGAQARDQRNTGQVGADLHTPEVTTGGSKIWEPSGLSDCPNRIVGSRSSEARTCCWLVLGATTCLALGNCAGSASTAPPATEPDPPIHLVFHPEIPPDEPWRDPVRDASAPVRDSASVSVSVADAAPAPPFVACRSATDVVPPLPAAKPQLRAGPPVTNYIPPEVIMRPIRARFQCFRKCYEQGLAENPRLAGRVTVHFVVDRDGWVRTSKLNGSDLPDPRVSSCIVREFVGLRYPSPEGDRISVVYPLVFAPDDGDAGADAR
jgi:hypothetical protein